MKRLIIATGLLLASVGAHAQEAAPRKMYVNTERLLVKVDPLASDGKTNGYLRAGDSVQVFAKRLAKKSSFDIGANYVWVTYPAYATVPAGSGWVTRRNLLGQRDSVSAERWQTREEVEALNKAYLAELQSTVTLKQNPSDGKNVRVIATGERKPDYRIPPRAKQVPRKAVVK